VDALDVAVRSRKRFLLISDFVPFLASWEIHRHNGIKWDPDARRNWSVGDDITFKLQRLMNARRTQLDSDSGIGIPAKQLFLRLEDCLGRNRSMQRQGRDDASSQCGNKVLFKAKD